jgi:hypothetical protein
MHIVCSHIFGLSTGDRAPERAMRNVWLGVALVPYLAAAGVDAWVHERGRRVPRVEQWIHAGLASAMALFLGAAFAGFPLVAIGALAVFLVLLFWDEAAFHGAIDARERRVHAASWAALALFVAVWWIVDLA